MNKQQTDHPSVSLYQTADGSHTLESQAYGATYHSIFGAIDESIHVFIMAGLDYQRVQHHREHINILEIGMGTGLNVWLAALWADKHHINITIHTIEKHPLDPTTTDKLNFNSMLPHLNDSQKRLLSEIHSSDWNTEVKLNSYTSLTKYHCDVLTHPYPPDLYDVIFFDAFAPNTQPELWTPEYHTLLYQSMQKNGALTTYCAKGVVKRMFKGIGYQLDQLPGPNRKHEMTRAIKA